MHANPYTWRTSNMIYRYFTFISWLANLQRDVDLNNFILHYIILYNHLSEKLNWKKYEFQNSFVHYLQFPL